MGQFGNQPDFAASSTISESFPITPTSPSAVFIGAVTVAGTGSITVRLVGDSRDTTFSGLNQGTFLPIMVTKVVSSVNIDPRSIVLYT